MYPSRFVLTGKKVKTEIFGLVLAHGDQIEANVTFKKSLNIDVNGRVPIHEGGPDDYNSSDVIILIDYEFTEREYILKYFGFMDILSKIGGIYAFASPILGLLAPGYILFYLYLLSQIIIQKHKDKFREEILDLYGDYKMLLSDQL